MKRLAQKTWKSKTSLKVRRVVVLMSRMRVRYRKKAVITTMRIMMKMSLKPWTLGLLSRIPCKILEEQLQVAVRMFLLQRCLKYSHMIQNTKSMPNWHVSLSELCGRHYPVSPRWFQQSVTQVSATQGESLTTLLDHTMCPSMIWPLERHTSMSLWILRVLPSKSMMRQLRRQIEYTSVVCTTSAATIVIVTLPAFWTTSTTKDEVTILWSTCGGCVPPGANSFPGLMLSLLTSFGWW